MKKIILISLLFSLLQPGSAQTGGYAITANIKPFQSGYLYLAYHFGSKQYLIDSAAINTSGNAIFKGDKKLQGGVYMIVYPQKNGWVECIIDQQQQFTVQADTGNVVRGLSYTGSSDNVIFGNYQKKSFEIGNSINQLRKEMTGKPGEPAYDSANARMRRLSNDMQQYRDNLQQNNPKHLLTSIFNLLKEPVVPPGNKHPGGKFDSTFAYNYYRDHFWDGISFTDERLIRTPVLQGRFDRYYDDVLPQQSDSLIRYADKMLAASKPNEEMFKFVLSSLTDKYVNPRYMGQDAVFVHLFEKYYLTGQAESWMNEKYRKFIYDRGYSLMANVIGKRAAELPMIDTTGKNFSLYTLQAPYTVLCFWDPTCSHCKEEVPKMDSIFQAKWKKAGVKLVGVMTDGGKDNWLKFIKDKNLKDWIHIYQTDATKDKIYKEGRPGYRQLYDVYQTPMVYLLDKDKNIMAKKLTYLQVDDFMDVKNKSTKTP
jgi:peroxiredoxin